jgi:hypothetical protein
MSPVQAIWQRSRTPVSPLAASTCFSASVISPSGNRQKVPRDVVLAGEGKFPLQAGAGFVLPRALSEGANAEQAQVFIVASREPR